MVTTEKTTKKFVVFTNEKMKKNEKIAFISV